jgi:hypothetical protein
VDPHKGSTDHPCGSTAPHKPRWSSKHTPQAMSTIGLKLCFLWMTQDEVTWIERPTSHSFKVIQWPHQGIPTLKAQEMHPIRGGGPTYHRGSAKAQSHSFKVIQWPHQGIPTLKAQETHPTRGGGPTYHRRVGWPPPKLHHLPPSGTQRSTTLEDLHHTI